MPSVHIPMLRGLAARQILVTLAVAPLAGLAIGSLELLAEWRVWRERIAAETRQNLELVRASAAESAYQLNTEQAGNVVQGLLSFEENARVTLRDNFGGILAQGARPAEKAGRLESESLDFDPRELCNEVANLMALNADQ